MDFGFFKIFGFFQLALNRGSNSSSLFCHVPYDISQLTKALSAVYSRGMESESPGSPGFGQEWESHI